MAALLASGILAGLTAGGCGHDGSVGVAFQPTPPLLEPAVDGTVLAPGGRLAAADRWWPRLDQLHLVPCARAQQCLANLFPAEGILNVALSRVSLIDAKDGHIDTPQLLSQTRTNGDGFYRIVDPAAADIEQCRLMVAVGGGDVLTRAFVTSHTTNIDAVTEAVVRVVLQRLTLAPPVQLCDFKNGGLENILTKAQAAACSAKGDTVAEMNESAFVHVRDNRDVKKAIDDATGCPVGNPGPCP